MGIKHDDICPDVIKIPELPEPTRYDKIRKHFDSLTRYIRIPLDAMFNYNGFFILIYIIGWTINGLYKDINFDLTALRDFYIMVVAKQLGEHGIDSFVNSPRGEAPKKAPTRGYKED